MRPVLFLTTHKAGSRFLHNQLIKRLARRARWEMINPADDAWRTGTAIGLIDDLSGRTECVVGPVRRGQYIERPELFDGWSKILLLRDPRDVATSYYFSVSTSHSLPEPPELRAKMLAMREQAQAETIDQYVLREAPGLLSRYLDYRDRFFGRPNLLLVRYEEMVTDWDAFAGRLQIFLGDTWHRNFWNRIRPGPGEFETVEDRASHKRQVRPGDHARKLRPETIAALDREFAPVLEWLDQASPVAGPVSA
jgi:hypothetical protein